MRLRETLKNWGYFAVDVTTDEEIGDILVAIKYHDHGDEFLYIKTYSGEEYEYGYYLNRKCCLTDFDINKNSGESDKYFIRRPIMYFDMTERRVSEASNDVFRCVHDDQFGFTDWTFSRKVLKRDNATFIFNKFIRTVNKYAESGVYYNFEHHKEIALKFIELNELGQEAIDRLNKLKWSSLKDGCAGIAGKREASDRIYCDGLVSVLYRGKRFDNKKVTRRRELDNFGYTRYSISPKQFQ